jgi:hypothetical protein
MFVRFFVAFTRTLSSPPHAHTHFYAHTHAHARLR